MSEKIKEVSFYHHGEGMEITETVIEEEDVIEFIKRLKEMFKSKNCQGREANPPYCNDCWNCISINNSIDKLAGEKLI